MATRELDKHENSNEHLSNKAASTSSTVLEEMLAKKMGEEAFK